MVRICNAEVSKGQCCKNCKWYQIDPEESEFYGEYRFSCFANPDKLDCVKWEKK